MAEVRWGYQEDCQERWERQDSREDTAEHYPVKLAVPGLAAGREVEEVQAIDSKLSLSVLSLQQLRGRRVGQEEWGNSVMMWF